MFTFKQKKREQAKKYFLSSTKTFYKVSNDKIPFTCYLLLTDKANGVDSLKKFIASLITEVNRIADMGYVKEENLGQLLEISWETTSIESKGDKTKHWLYTTENAFRSLAMDLLTSDFKDDERNIKILEGLYADI